MKANTSFLLTVAMSALAIPPAHASAEKLILNAKMGYPQILAGEFGWIFGKMHNTGSWTTEVKGLYTPISPGITGTKLSGGYAGQTFSMSTWGAARLSASYLYMYDDVDRYEADSHYFGPEANLSLVWFSANFGVLWSLDSGDPRVIDGIGIGW